MKLGFAFLLTLSMVVSQAMAQSTSQCPSMFPYYCDRLGKCVENVSACAIASTTGTTTTQSPCADSASTLQYWCAPLKRCMANAITCANLQAAWSSTTTSYGTSTTYGTGTQSSGYGTTTQSSGYGTSSSSSACASNASYQYWCDATQNCVLSAAACPTALYTSFTGPTTLDCLDNAYCKSYVTSQGKCPNDSISMGSYYLKMNNGQYTIGEGCTVTCRGCEDSGTYVAPSGTSVASGYVYGGTTVNGPGGGAGGGAGAGGGGGGGGGGYNNVAINTPNGVAYYNPNTHTMAGGGRGGGGGGGNNKVAITTANGIACFDPSNGSITPTSGGGCGPQDGGGGGNNKNNKNGGRKLRGA